MKNIIKSLIGKTALMMPNTDVIVDETDVISLNSVRDILEIQSRIIFVLSLTIPILYTLNEGSQWWASLLLFCLAIFSAGKAGKRLQRGEYILQIFALLHSEKNITEEHNPEN